jgi:hypothetical protein
VEVRRLVIIEIHPDHTIPKKREISGMAAQLGRRRSPPLTRGDA